MRHATIQGPPFPHYVVGLDLGKTADFTAAAVLELMPRLNAGATAWVNHYTIVDLLRAPLGQPYPNVVANVKAILGSPLLRPYREYLADSWTRAVKVEPAPNPQLVIDATGVGAPIVDMVLAAGMPAGTVPVTITAGAGQREDVWPGSVNARAYWVAKIDLVAATVNLMQSGRLEVAEGLDLGPTLRSELETFEYRVTKAANAQFSHRDGEHDDLVLAVSLACWYAEFRYKPPPVDNRIFMTYHGRDGGLKSRPIGPAEHAEWSRKYRG